MVATAAACWWLVEAPPPPAMRFSGCCWVPEELSWPAVEGRSGGDASAGEWGGAVTLAFGVFGPEAKRLGVVLVEGEDLLLLPLTAFGGGDPRALHVRRALKPSALTANSGMLPLFYGGGAVSVAASNQNGRISAVA
nr:hypothetical protein Iba_chr15dCG2880 [Ipomoea batatas]